MTDAEQGFIMTGQLMRMAGVLLVFLASTFLGKSMEQQMKKRWQILREMCEVLRYLEKEMIFHRTPLEEALVAASGIGSIEITGMLKEAAEGMKQRKGNTFRDIWRDAVVSSLGDGILTEQEMETIANSWTAFCNPDVVLQKTMLDKQLLRMEESCRKAETEYREKAGLYRKLGAAGGIFLIILLL